MVIRSFESDKISYTNDFQLFSNDNLIVLFVCSDDTPNFLSMFFYDVIVELMNIHEIKCKISN